MADISKITLPDDTTYNIKDNNARNFTNTPYYEQDEEALMFQLGESYMTGEQDNQPYLFRAAGGSADIGNREYDKIVGGTVAWNQLVRDEASTNETDFADIVTVDDAVEDAAAVKIAIEPVQDLHGYDHPWPAGGSANKWDEEWEIGAISTTTGQNLAGLSQIRAKNHIPVVEGNTYCVVTRTGRTNGIWILFYDEEKNVISEGLPYGGQVSSNARMFDNGEFLTIPANCAYIRFYFQTYYGTEYAHDTAINYPSTETSYVPYSNICPITGWDAVKVTRTGKNLFNVSDWWLNSGGFTIIDSNTIVCENSPFVEKKNKYILPKTGNYVLSFHAKTLLNSTGKGRVTIASRTKDDKPISQASIRIILGEVGTEQDFVLAMPDTTYFFNIRDWAYDGRVELSNIQLELSDTVTDYELYQGETYDITFPSEAGTVYGGTLDVSTGKLVVDRISAQLTGTAIATSWATADANRDSMGFYTNRQNWRANTGLPLPVEGGGVFDYCHVDIIYATDNWWAARFLFINGQFNRFEIRIPKNVLPSLNTTGAKAYLNEHPLQVVYKIAPQTYTLTTSQIRTLLGTNNVWADAGQVSLSYTGTDEHLVLKSSRKYFTRISGTDSVLLGSGQEITVEKGMNNVFDLTQMFGSTIANYIYSLETATPGAGVAWFRKLFPKPYYEYNPGELMSVQAVAHKLVGFNAWDEEWELGIINTTTGEETDSNSNIRSKNYIRVIPGATYYFKLGTTDISNNIVFYDAEKNYVAASGEHVNDVFTVPEDAHYMKFYMSTNYGRTYLSNICINLSGNGERDGEYEEYKLHSYPLDSSLTLRGIPKLDANHQLYYDGDVYESDGTVTRRYGIVDLGTLTWVYRESFKTMISTDIASLVGNGPNIRCSAYITATTLISTYWSEHDKVIALNKAPNVTTGNWRIGTLAIKDTAYTDAVSFKAAMSGVMLVYELETPTTEIAEPYDNPQIVASEGTEEYITTNIVFVGHETKY